MRWLLKNIKNEEGQSTVEYAIVTAALLVVVLGLGLFWKLGEHGIFVDHAQSSASHHLEDAAAGIVGDVFSC